MEPDTSQQAIPGILSSYHVANVYKQLYPVVYHAKALSATEYN